MPTIICSYCQYIGSGTNSIERFENVEEHEKTCKENPDVEPVEDEYELCEIFESDLIAFKGLLVYRFMVESEDEEIEIPISNTPDSPNFAGYLYEDGFIVPQPVQYRDKDSVLTTLVASEEFMVGKFKVLRPTHVVFKK